MSLVWLAGIQTAVRGQECLPDNMNVGSCTSCMLFREKALRNFGYNISFIV